MEKAELKHLATLSALSFTEEELNKFSKEFDNIKAFVDQIQSAETDSEYMFDKTIDFNDLREDNVTPGLSNEEVLQSAPKKKDGAFVVPKVVG